MNVKISDDEKMNLFELTLPKYLKKDIEALVEGIRVNSTLLDCLWGKFTALLIPPFMIMRFPKNRQIICGKSI